MIGDLGFNCVCVRVCVCVCVLTLCVAMVSNGGKKEKQKSVRRLSQNTANQIQLNVK